MKTYLILTIIFTNYIFAFGQVTIPNANFEQLDNSSNTKSLYWKTVGSIDQCIIDSNVVWKGKYSMHLTRKTFGGKGFFYQDLPFKTRELKKYKISCAVKTKDIKEQFAGVGARVYDKEGNSITGYNALEVNGTKDWKVYSGEFYSDELAVTIKIFGNLQGSGEMWVDDITIEEVPLNPKKISTTVNKYVDEYFKIVRENSIIKDSAYITELEKRTKLLCSDNSGLEYCHNILKRYTTLKLNDGHSFFSTPQDWKDMQNGDKTIQDGLANFSTGKMMKENIAYINVPMFVSFDTIVQNKAVDSLQSIIATLDKQNPKGWIIDISNNPGGNSFVMLCGLGPILGNGVCGYCIFADGSKKTRIHNEGWTGWDSTLIVNKSNPYHLKNSNLPIAVIYGNNTGSSGEAVAISFRGKENTMSFGQETSGANTNVGNFALSDGASLNLAQGFDADRNGVTYNGKPIPPDKVTKDNESALTEAIKWITEKRK